MINSLLQKQKLLIQYYETKEKLKDAIIAFNHAIRLSFILDKIIPNYETFAHQDILNLNKEIDKLISLRDSIFKELNNE